MKWVGSGLWYALCALWMPIRLHSTLCVVVRYAFIFPAYLQIIQMWELHGSALFSFLFSPKFFSQLLLKACLHLFDYMELLSWSPRQIKSKEFKWSEELERGWKRSVLAFILHQNTLSLPGHNYSPDLFWTTLTESQMNTPSSLVWTCITFAVDQEQKLFAKLFRSTECYYFPSPTFHVAFIFGEANILLFPPWPVTVS